MVIRASGITKIAGGLPDFMTLVIRRITRFFSLILTLSSACLSDSDKSDDNIVTDPSDDENDVEMVELDRELQNA